MWQNCLRKKIEKIRRKIFGVKSGNIFGSRKSRFWPSVSTLPMPWKKNRKSMTLMKLRVSTAIKKVIMPVIVLSQKTSIGLDNFYIND